MVVHKSVHLGQLGQRYACGATHAAGEAAQKNTQQLTRCGDERQGEW
jgi:hypothetical protein